LSSATDPEALRRAARRFGTPLYVTDLSALAAAAAEVREAFPDPWLRHYSVKANDVPAVIAAVAAQGFGANVVSRGEWAAAVQAGVANHQITLEGIGKTTADLRAAASAARNGRPLRWVSIESPDEAAALAAILRGSKLRGWARAAASSASLDVLYRLNPDVSPETLPGLAVGAGHSKFGMTETELGAAIEASGGATGPLRPRGIHIHIGSQLGAVDAWRDAVRRALAMTALWRGSIESFDTLDVGGGFPVFATDEPAPGPGRFARELPDLLDAIPSDRRPGRLSIEPGRFLVARAGWLLASVLHVRDRDGPQVVLDAGMTELIRPALYGARHPVIALTSLGRPVDTRDARPLDGGGARQEHGRRAQARTQVEGPICESTDSLGEHDLPPLRRGDLVAIADAGAYAASQSSTYNGRPRPPQVLLDADGTLRVGRRRGRTALSPGSAGEHRYAKLRAPGNRSRTRLPAALSGGVDR
jgi:diaminopimelate decarboxylase